MSDVVTENEKCRKMGELLKDKFVVTFIGSFVRNNDPSVLVKCAGELRDKGICFVLAGDGELLEEIRSKSSSLSNVLMPGWLNAYESAYLLKHSHLGICPTSQARNAFPNKVFSYLSAGLPVVSAFEGELKEFLEKHHAGFYYPYSSADALTECIRKLHDDPVLYRDVSENAKKVFACQMLETDMIYAEYARHIEKVCLGNGFAVID